MFGIFQIDEVFANFFRMGFKDLILKTSYIASHLHYDYIFMHLDVCYICAIDYVLVGLDWAEPIMQFPLHVTCSCIPMHTYFLFNIFLDIFSCLGLF